MIGPAASSELLRLAINYNDALNRCTQTGGANIDELTELFADDATWVVVGVRDVVGVAGTSLVGKDSIRASFLSRTALFISNRAKSKGSTYGVTWSSAGASVAIRPSPNLGSSPSCGSCW